MAKQRHQEPESGSSFNPIIILVVGVVLVGGLVAWALTRTVEVAPTPTPAAEQTQIADAQQGITTTATGNSPVGTATATLATGSLQSPPVDSDHSDIAVIAAEDLHAKWSRGEVTVIDVRDAASFEAGHITGSLHFQFAAIEGQLDLIPKAKPIVLYCTCPHEESSKGAAEILKQHGINNVSALYGGLNAWRSLGYPVAMGPQ